MAQKKRKKQARHAPTRADSACSRPPWPPPAARTPCRSPVYLDFSRMGVPALACILPWRLPLCLRLPSASACAWGG